MLYNAMIAPLGNSPIKGVVWYQGESNSGHPDTYPRLLGTLISDWRKQFDTPQLPFFIVQLPDYASQWDGFYWPWQREAQAKVVQSTPNTDLVIGINTTDGFNLHPKQKLEIGRRTALLARRDVYGENIVASGPVFKSARISGATVEVAFEPGDGGLSNSSPGEVKGFMVAGHDGIYRFADAKIDGSDVILHYDQIPAPETVRYAWTGVPDSTLVNESGLPASPFRTDNFPCSNVEVQKEPVSHQVTTSAYEISVDGNGKITSLIVHGSQFISNEPGSAGGTSIPGAFGPRALAGIENLGPNLLACSDNDITFLLNFHENTMEWVLTNRSKDDLQFSVALNPKVTVTPTAGTKSFTLTHKKSSLTINGVDEATDSDDGKILQVTVKGGTSRQIQFDMSNP
jgi:sialate O-acetylesterase